MRRRQRYARGCPARTRSGRGPRRRRDRAVPPQPQPRIDVGPLDHDGYPVAPVCPGPLDVSYHVPEPPRRDRDVVRADAISQVRVKKRLQRERREAARQREVPRGERRVGGRVDDPVCLQ